MDWSKLTDTLLGAGLPLLGGVIGGPAGAGVGKLIASALGVGDDPDAVAAAIETNPEAVIRLRELELAHERELQAMLLRAQTVSLEQTNQTFRQAILSDDSFVRRARPSIVWSISVSIVLEVAVAAAVVLFAPDRIGDLGELYSALAVPQSVAAAAAGIYMPQRSRDKAVAAGHAPKAGLLQVLADRIAG